MATTTAISFASLVGAQLTALIEAEAEAAETSAEFIENVGFEKDPNTGVMKLRSVTFEMLRRDVDGKTRKHLISVPVLTLVPIPLLTIEEADLEFDLTVETIKTETSDERPSRPSAGRPAAPSAREALLARNVLVAKRPKAQLITKFARTRKENSQTKTMADLNLKVRVAQSPFPLGIERLLNTADLSVEDRTDD